MKNGSPFSTALGLRIAFLLDNKTTENDTVNRAIRWLNSKQLGDGSWQSSAFMRVPPMGLLIPDQFDYEDWVEGMDKNWGVISRDQHRIFTTATVLYTLHMLLD